MQKTSLAKLLETLFIRSWWVILFVLLCFILFEQGIKKRDQDFTKLSEQLAQLELDKEKALKTKEDLQLHINSESDPAWIELTLMKELGLSPDDYVKIFFKAND
jgi:hypothetical protein